MLITSVIVVAVILFVFLGGIYFGGHKVAINVNVKISQLSKLREMNCIYEEWIKFENNGNYIVDYLNKKNIKNVVVYGGTAMAECLIGKIKNDINILAIMDKDDSLDFGIIPTLKPGKVPLGTDCIIITTIGKFKDISDNLKKYNDVPMIYISDIFRIR